MSKCVGFLLRTQKSGLCATLMHQQCMNCVQVLPFVTHHRPLQVRTNIIRQLAIPYACSRYEQPVTKRNCVYPKEVACFLYQLHVSNRNWIDAKTNACINAHLCNRDCMYAIATASFKYVRFLLRTQQYRSCAT